MAKKETTYEEIIAELKNKQYRPIYFLYGEEPYYIDKISDFILENVLTAEEREFNQMFFMVKTLIFGQLSNMQDNFRWILNIRWWW